MRIHGTVYVVDDDTPTRRALTRLLSVVGLEVYDFASAEEFLSAALNDGPSCLLLDVQLPGLSGLDLQSMFAPGHETMPIIFLTGYGTIPDCAHAIRSGAVEFFQKPVDSGRLLSVIDSALNRSRMALAAAEERRGLLECIRTLTRREREVMHLVATGILNKQIAFALGAAEKTIKIHRARVMQKMAADSVADLVRILHKLGMDTALGESPPHGTKARLPIATAPYLAVSANPGEPGSQRAGAGSAPQAQESYGLRYR